MFRNLLIPLALVLACVVSGCKSGTTVSVPTPNGPVVVTYDGNAAQAYKKLEKALADCLDLYTAAVLNGDQATASGWQDVIDSITGAKEDLANDKMVRDSSSTHTVQNA